MERTAKPPLAFLRWVTHRVMEKFSKRSHKQPNLASKRVLRVQNLTKAFASTQALDGVTFTLRKGERLALLGPNGAGKTTLIRCLAGRTKPDDGSIEMLGRPIETAGVRDSLGIVPQEIALYGDLTTRENLHAFGKFHGLRRGNLRERIDWALHWTGLEDRADTLVGGFSGGMKRRVNLACGVMHSPSILLLDEPTVGVDPQSRQKIFSMLDQLNQIGTTIMLTTHHLDEAQQRSDRIVIVDRGRVAADGTLDELVNQSIGTSRLVKVRVDRPLQGEIAAPKMALRQVANDQLTARIDDVSKELPRLLGAVEKSGYRVADIEVNAPSLHHVFLHLTGHELRD